MRERLECIKYGAAMIGLVTLVVIIAGINSLLTTDSRKNA